MQAKKEFTLAVSDLSKRFNREWVFRNVSLDLQSGNIYAVTGPNGSGKSTLLHVLSGMVPPTSGQLKYTLDSKAVEVEAVADHLAIAAPYMDLIEEFTLREQIAFHFSLKPIRPGIAQEDLLEILYLRDASDKFIRNFSSGMKQRLKLGLAMYSNVSLLILDEPGSHLDERAFAWYKDQFNLLPKDMLVLVGSNDPVEYPPHAHAVNLVELKGRPA